MPLPFVRPLRAVAFALVVLVSVSAARAASIAVLFDGPLSSGQHYGLSSAAAVAAQAVGVPLLPGSLSSARDRLRVIAQDLESLNLTPDDLVTPFEARSAWTAQNVSGNPFQGDAYLVFTTADPRPVALSTGSVIADHDESRVGLRIDSADGWALFRAVDASLGPLYYPGVRLGALAANAQAQVDVNYFLNQLLTYQDGNTTQVPLPRLRIALAVVPVPEPMTALLVTLGIGALGVASRARSRRGAALLGVVALGIALVSERARAADEALVLRMSAARLAAEGRCDEALASARRARALAPDDGAAAAVEGHCLLQLQRYAEAAGALADATRLAPQDAEAAVELVMANYHLGDRERATAVLANAKALAPNDARVSLYEGLLLAQGGDDQRAAAEALERAGKLDADVDPYASYFAGQTWRRAAERGRAREALERARERAAGGPYADEIERALADLDSGAQAPGLWLRAMAGLEYDDNVVLRGDASQPGDVSDERDGVGVWSLQLGAEPLRNRDWALGVMGGYQGNAHFDQERFDLHYPTLSTYLDRRVDDASFLRLQSFGGYAWTDEKPYVGHGGGDLSYHRSYGDAGRGRAWLRAGYNDYLFPIQTPARVSSDPNDPDRDGWDLRAGYDHAYSLSDSTLLRAGLGFGAYLAQGRDYDGYSFGPHLGFRQLLPWSFELDADASYAWEPYDHPSSYPRISMLTNQPDEDGDREDHVVIARVELSRPITEWLTASARYRYVDQESNYAFYDYDRHIVGGYLTFTWDR
jgi:tetratricopeptide (TPR) repeat protein